MTSYKIFNNLDIVLNISKYLIEPSVLIMGHYYDKIGNLNLIYNTKHSESQIDDYITILYNKYCHYKNNISYANYINYNYIITENENYNNSYENLNNNTLLFLIIKDTEDINNFWRNINHSIYIDMKYIKYLNDNFGHYSHLYERNIIENYDLNKFYSIFRGYNFKEIIQQLTIFLQQLRLSIFQNEIRYIKSYFDDFNGLNNDLSKFTPSNILQFIKDEDLILEILLNDDI